MENSINLNLFLILQFITVLLTGLLAGLFYGYDCSVTKGLENISNVAYLEAFQAINKAIQNAYFFMSFMGCLFILPITTWLSYKTFSATTFYLLLVATLVYTIGVFGITIFGNIPLNEQLAKISISSATESELSILRNAFERPWNFYHKIRTVASIICFCLTIISIINVKFKS